MKNIFFIFMVAFAWVGCTQAEKIEDKGTPKAWANVEYKTCDVKISPNSKMPFDIGFTAHRTDLDWYDNFSSMRAFYAKASQNSAIELASNLIEKPRQTSMHIDTWSADGQIAYIRRRWEDPDNAMAEQHFKKLQIREGAYLIELFALDMKTMKAKNLTASPKVSFFNYGIFPWPAEPGYLAFHAYIDGLVRPLLMKADGSGKKEISHLPGFAYAAASSPDGTSYAFNLDYKLSIGRTKSSEQFVADTPWAYHIRAAWSLNSQYVAFVGGPRPSESYIGIVDRDGKNFKNLAWRNNFSGSAIIFDTPDVQDGSTDYLAWSHDSQYVYYSSNSPGGEAVEIYRASVKDGQAQRLTNSKRLGAWNYFPNISPDGKWLTFVSNEIGRRNLAIMKLDDPNFPIQHLTDLDKGCAISWPYWRPTPQHKRL